MEEERMNQRIEEFRRKLANVDYSITLPDTELEVMMAVWSCELPVTSRKLMNSIGDGKGWKTATVISFLTRLEDRGFLMSYKDGKERSYVPIADRELYLAALTERFVRQVHSGSYTSMLDSLFFEKNMSDEDIDELAAWLKKRFE